MPDFENVRYVVEEGIATLTLHRPARLNAVNTAMLREIVSALDAADGDDEVRAVIVTGAGRAFCAGADLGEGGKTFDPKIDASDNLSAVAVSTGCAKAEVSRIFQDPTEQSFAPSEDPAKESATSH